MSIRVLLILSCLLLPVWVQASSVRLVDASLSETLAAFAALTGDVYGAPPQVEVRVTLYRNNINTIDEARSLLVETLAGLGLKVIQNGEGSYTLVPEDVARPVDAPRTVRRISIEGRVDRRGLEQMIAVDPLLDGLVVIPDGTNNRSVLVSGNKVLIDRLEATLIELPALDSGEQPVHSPATKRRPAIELEAAVGPTKRSAGFAVVDLRYADAESVVAALGGIERVSTESGKISAHIDKNQVIVIGPASFVETVSSVVEAMDRAPRQVFIDAIVAEVSEQTTRQLGIQFSGRSGEVALGLVSGTAGASLGAVADSTMLSGVTGGLLALGGAATQFPDLGILLTALEADGDTRILATPSLMAMENRDSEILVGQNVPFLTGRYSSTDGATAASPFQTIEREDLGTILRFRPRVGRDGTLLLDITQEVSRLDTSTSGLSDVATIKRELSTVVSAKSGETIVIGGLRDEQLEVTESKIPGLGDLPVLGHLFRQESVRTVSRNLVIFLRPTLVSEENQRIKILSRWESRVKSDLGRGEGNGFGRVFGSPPVIEKMPGVLSETPLKGIDGQ